MATPRAPTQQSIVFLILQRMRPPLLVLIGAYSISVLGLVLIPGQTADGESYRMDFLHAFYFVSYTATTIGFGEIPHTFTGAQRLWVLITLYLTVVAWFYAIGTIIGLIRDPAFQQAITFNRFRTGVRRLIEPFYLVCGYGETGSQLVHHITDRNARAVVLDIDQTRISALGMTNLRSHVPALCADANVTDNLLAAGLAHPRCRAVLAVTDGDHTNLQIAITAKLLNPSLEVVCRAETDEAQANMASFGTDHVINPFETFARGLELAIECPSMHRLYEWMSSVPDIPLSATGKLPPTGTWIICGYGRLGQALYRRLRQAGVSPVVVAGPDPRRDLPHPHVEGKGTEASTLREAGVEQASALVAATADDADNLSIVMTARELKPDLYLVARQNQGANLAIFQAAQLDMIMEPSSTMAMRMLRLLATPMLPRFLGLLRRRGDGYVATVLERLQTLVGDAPPSIWALSIVRASAPALTDALDARHRVVVDTLLRHPLAREERLPAEVLMIHRDGENLPMPAGDLELRPGDRLLLCGKKEATGRLSRTVSNVSTLRYVMTGEVRPDGSLWRWIARRKAVRGG